MSNAVLTYDAPTRMQGKVIELKKGGKWMMFPGSATVGRHRKSITIRNGDPNTRVYLVAGPDQRVDPDVETVILRTIKVDQEVELLTNANIVLKNIQGPGGEDITGVSVLELFYDL